jgi:magnesium transporter
MQRSSSSPDLPTLPLDVACSVEASPSSTTYAISSAITTARRRSRAYIRPARAATRLSSRASSRAEARASSILGGVVSIRSGVREDDRDSRDPAFSLPRLHFSNGGSTLRRLFNLRRHVASVLTRSESSFGDHPQQLPAASVMPQAQSRSRSHPLVHRSTSQSQPDVDTALDMDDDRDQSIGLSKQSSSLFKRLALHADNGTSPGDSTPSIVAPDADEQHLHFARRRHKLRCIEFDTEGNFVERSLSRQEILIEARGALHTTYNVAGVKKRNQQQRTQPVALSVYDRDRYSERRTRNLRNKTLWRSGGAPGAGGGAAQRFVANVTRQSDRNALTMRDIRQVDPAFTAKAALWVRQNALVVSLEPVRAIIMHNKVYLFDPDNPEVQRPIRYIQQRLSDGVHNVEEAFMPFEFRALEGILIHSCIRLEKEFAGIEPPLIQTLRLLPSNINAEYLELLRRDEQRLNHFYSRSRKVQNVLQAVLDDDEDMACMYLTEKYKTPEVVRNPVDHDEAEMLIESYLQVVDDLTNKAALLNTAIDDTENLIEIHLDTMQNKLLLVNLLITVITTIVTFGTAVTAVFGMNLPLPIAMAELPTSSYYFSGVVVMIIVVMCLLVVVLTIWSRSQGIYSRRHILRQHLNQSSRREGIPVTASMAKILS